MIIAIRLRSMAKGKKDIRETLRLLRLNKRHNAVLIKDTPSMKGMLLKARDYITYGIVSDDVLKELIAKRGRKEGNVKLTEKEVHEAFEKMKRGEKSIKPVFCLTPPSGGFKNSIKRHYPIVS